MSSKQAHKEPLKEPVVYVPKFKVSKHPFAGMKVKKLEKQALTVESAAAEGQTKVVQNSQTATVTLYRKIDLIHYIQDPYTFAEKELMEAAARRNFAVRVSLWVREQMAFRKSKLIIDLPDDTKIDMTADEIQEKLEGWKNDAKAQEILRKFRTRDTNLKLPQQHIKTLATQCFIFGRGLTMIFYKGDNYNNITKLMTINSRRLGEPVLDEQNDLSFEGCMVDGQGLDKDSMIYATYFDREISPHTESHGYSPTEPIIYIVQAHNVLLEEDVNEIVKSAWLPSILLPIITAGQTGSNKSTQISRIIDGIDPAKILGIDAESLGGDPQMLDLKPDFTGINELADRLEEKIYNNYHIPLFLIKSDKIANIATAQKSAQMFIEGTVADDQTWMENLLADQWYDPLLRDELKNVNLLEATANPDVPTVNTKSVDTSSPTDAQAPLPFIIRRRFEKPTIEDLIEMSGVVAQLLDKKVIDIQKAHEMLHMEDITTRVSEQNQAKEEQDLKMKQQEFDAKTTLIKTETASMTVKSQTEVEVAKILLHAEQIKRRTIKDMKEIADKVAN